MTSAVAGRRSKKQATLEHDTDEFRFLLRLPPEMSNALRAEAEAEFRPMNAQILYIIDQHLRAEAKAAPSAARRVH